jgi:hypothetical protein
MMNGGTQGETRQAPREPDNASERPLMDRFRTCFHPTTIGAYALIFAVVATSSMSTAEARRHFSMAQARSACTGDAIRLCSQYIPSRGRITACLSRNRGSLSPGCHAVFS